MIASLLLLSAAAQPPAGSAPEPPEESGVFAGLGHQVRDIVVTATLGDPVDPVLAPGSATVIPAREIVAVDLPHTADLLRLVPGVSVSVSGPAGSQTQLRIRGAEANHTLLFIDGIRFNDPASGNEARFELLNSDLFQHIEVVRGPQSALWGADALGGVVSVSTGGGPRGTGLLATGEYGSLESVRLAARGSAEGERFGLTVTGAYLSSQGIDSFGAGGERDGFDNKSLGARLVFRASDDVELGLVGHHVEGSSSFDGLDPVTFARADTLDATDNRISAVGGWVTATPGNWALGANLSYLDSANHNRVGADPLNSTYGDRITVGGRLGYRFGKHELTGIAEYQAEGFAGRDTQFGGGTNQDVARDTVSFAGEWRAEWAAWLQTDLAVRHDNFSNFASATTLRGSVLVRPSSTWALHAAYGEGIAQPTFYDLYGFFPGSFVGNPKLTPETSVGWEAGIRYGDGRLSAAITYFDQNLTDEIVDTFSAATSLSSTANTLGESRRRGVEAEVDAPLAPWAKLRLSYTYLDADEQRAPADALVREVRRPRHSGSAVIYGERGRLNWSATASYVGERTDTNFDVVPAATVQLGAYVLASARVAYRLPNGLEAFARVENAFDSRYQDVFGYATPGATAYAGFRLALGR